jgi:putative transcriptional regulator
MTEELKNTLKVQRAIRDLTQADLATLAGITRKSVNAIETGRMVPSVFLALKIARLEATTEPQRSSPDVSVTLWLPLDQPAQGTYA